MKAEQKFPKTAQSEPPAFGLKDKIGYLLGDLGNDFFFILMSSFLTVYYTNVLGIPGSVVGILFLTARFVDAFTDLGMGRIVDTRPPGEDGQFRPWIRRMRFWVILAGVLVFLPWAAKLPMPARIVYVFVTYIFWGSFCYTAINIPYGSMASVITGDDVERSALSTFRSMGAAFAGVVVGVLVPQIVYLTDASGNQILSGNRMFVTALVFAVLAWISYTLCYCWSTERVRLEKKKKTKQNAGELVRGLLRNRALVAIIAAAVVLLLALFVSQTMNVYLFQDYFKSKSAMSLANLLSTACTLLLAPFSGVITEKIGKKEASGVAVLFSAAVFGILFFWQIHNPWLFCLFLFLGNLGTGLFNLLIWAFISDIIDYQTLLTGTREGGTVYAVYSFARKSGQALAGGLSGWMISWIGYQVSSGTKAVVQSQEVLDNIYRTATGIPALGYLLVGLILLFGYPLSRRKLEEIRQKLETGA